MPETPHRYELREAEEERREELAEKKRRFLPQEYQMLEYFDLEDGTASEGRQNPLAER